MVTEAQVRDCLGQVIDPELGLNVVDLGLVYGIDVSAARIHVALTMTTRACPLHTFITDEAHAAIRGLAPDIPDIDIEMVWDPPWSPAMMSAKAKQQLGWRG